MIEVIKPGLLTTVQDAGRFGYQRLGVPVAGAMDGLSLQVANLLAGNPMGEAALELTMSGPTLRFLTPSCFALAGAGMEARLDGQPLEIGRAYAAPRGSVLALGYAASGCRCYLAVAGGFDLPLVMGSRSTYLKGGFGGLEGRALKAGDRLPLRAPQPWLNRLPDRAAPQPEASACPTVRVVLGPQDGCFSQEGLDRFFSTEYEIDANSDRMGYRLRGGPVSRRAGFDGNIVSDGAAMGSIQVPDSQPIVLMADRQTTGGYAKLGAVITCDLPKLAQLKAGDKVRFERVGIEQAQALYRKRARLLRALAHALELPEGLWD